jgi:hypothetical protein
MANRAGVHQPHQAQDAVLSCTAILTYNAMHALLLHAPGANDLRRAQTLAPGANECAQEGLGPLAANANQMIALGANNSVRTRTLHHSQRNGMWTDRWRQVEQGF